MNKSAFTPRNLVSRIFGNAKSRVGAVRRRKALRKSAAATEALENRQLLTTFTVNSLTDGAPDASNDATEFTLREAIIAANDAANPGADTIVFQTGLTGAIELTEGELQITDDLTITGPGAASDLVIDAQQSSRVIQATDAVTNLTLNHLTITGGKTTDDGGGIQFDGSSGSTLFVNSSTISGNQVTGDSRHGGGINSFSGAVTLTNSTVSGNSTTGNYAFGGGIFIGDSGTVTLTNSTVSGNSTTGSDADGGGIYASFGAVTLTNSTVSGNTATRSGGGISTSYGAVTLTNSTVSGNTAGDQGGGIGLYASGSGESLTVHNSIIAGNLDNGNAPDFTAPNGTGNLTVEHSIIGDATGTTLTDSNGTQDADGNFVGIDWKTVLQNNGVQPTLADNGGPTQTIALLPNSPAIGTADPALLPLRELINGVSATATDFFSGFEADNVLEDSNLTAADFAATTSPGGSGNAWVTNDPNGGTGDYFANGTTAPVLTFDLGELQTLSNVAIWGYSTAAGNDLKDFTLEFSTDGGTTFGDPVSLTKEMYDATTNFVSVLALNGPVQANFVRMTVTDNHFEDGAGGDRVGFNEIRFLSPPNNDQRGVGFPRQVGLPDIGAFEAAFVDTLLVDSSADGNDGDYSPGQFTLREAIDVANQTAGTDEITFAPALSGEAITLNGSDIDITDSLNIVGPGADLLTISGNELSRIFEITGPSSEVTIEGLTFVDGNDSAGGGGAIRANSIDHLTVVGSVFDGNTTSTFGGAIDMDGTGELTVVNSTFIENSAGSGGGAIENNNQLNVENSTFVANTTAAFGGAISAGASGAIRNSTIIGNTADSDSSSTDIRGGGLAAFNGFTVHNSIIAGNFNIQNGVPVPDEISGTLNSASSHNIIGGGATGGFDGGLTDGNLGNQVGVDWTTVVENSGGTLTLADNGGSVPTVALIPTGPAIDAGDNAEAIDSFGNSLITDGRDSIFPRLSGTGSTVDVGAVERFSGFALGGILRDDPNPTAADTVAFSVDFNRDVSGVEASSFSEVATGSVTISNLQVNDAGDNDDSTYQVVATGVQGVGTLTLQPGSTFAGFQFPIVEAYDIVTAPVLDADGTLQIQGTAEDDVITVIEDGVGSTAATLNGMTWFFATSEVTGVNILANSGDDIVSADVSVPVSMLGAEGNDTLTGGDGNDSLNGGDGADILRGGRGNDSLAGGEGTDDLTGGDGDDTLSGGSGNDTIIGGAGNDSLLGGDGNDALVGDTGDDTVRGGSGNDIATGNAGSDLVVGDAGNDNLEGNDGTDTVNGGAGNDTLDGGDGNDAINGGTENDIITDLSGDTTVVSGKGDDTVTTGAGADSIRTNGGNDVVDAGDGDDSVRAGGGDDTITTGNGNDFVSAGSQKDVIDAGAGDDEVRGGNQGDLIIAGTGNDSIVAGRGADTVLGQAGDDTIQGNTGDDVLVGGIGDDLIGGNADQDIQIGGAGSDTLNAGGTEDLLIGGTTDFDEDANALGTLRFEWIASRNQETRVANLRDGSGSNNRNNGDNFLVANTTVQDDNAVDELKGGTQLDWFFAKLGTGADADLFIDLENTELVDELT